MFPSGVNYMYRTEALTGVTEAKAEMLFLLLMKA